jgi:hypothetical protein
MSLAEEAMAKALASPGLPNVGGVPKVAPPESVEPTLIQGATGNAPKPQPPKPPPSPGGGIDLRSLQETVRVDPEETEKAVKEAVHARASNPGPPASPIPLASSPPGALPSNASTVALDEPPGAPGGAGRKPTSELLPVKLPEERASQRPEPPTETALWRPKGRKLGGAAALLIGIMIGALLVATALVVAISLRR